MTFPVTRPRRLRMNPIVRELVQETRLSPYHLIYPMFVCPGEGVKKEIPSMPGNCQFSTDALVEEVRAVKSLGVQGIILFGIPETKDAQATSAYDDQGVVQNAVRALKREVKDVLVITDVCLCEYTSHGHCGLVENNEICNDSSVDMLAKTALSHVKAGADMVAPSDMMDGRVGAIRAAMEKGGHKNTPILSYAVKYASAFYGPFREAAESTPAFGDRRSHQMDPANAREALREAALDIEEGADILMVKPAGPYLDIIRMIRDRYPVPVAAFQVSGEYSALMAAARMGWLDLQRTMLETLIGIRRAGADIILTYFAREAAKLLS
jgi:porphobilinogen synthase